MSQDQTAETPTPEHLAAEAVRVLKLAEACSSDPDIVHGLVKIAETYGDMYSRVVTAARSPYGIALC